MRRTSLLFTVLLLALLPAAAGATAFPDRIPLPDGFFPEGIAIGGQTAYVGSLIDGAIVSQDLRTGETTTFAPSPDDGRGTAIAVGMDVRNGRLWVAGGGAAVAPTVASSVRAYDTATGELVYERAVVAAAFVNDVIVTEDAAWFTDSFVPQLIRVPIHGSSIGEPEYVPITGDYVPGPGFGLNGIEATGDQLVLAQSTAPGGGGAALYAVDADADAPALAARRIALDDVLVGADGLTLVGRTLHVTAGAPGVVEVELTGDLTAGAVGSTTPVPGSVTPTTAAAFGDDLYVVDAKFPFLGAPTTAFDTVAVPR